MDSRLLAVDGNYVCMGAGNLGSAPPSKRSLGRRSLGASLQRLGVGPRPLAIARDRVTLTSLKLSQKSAARRSLHQIR